MDHESGSEKINSQRRSEVGIREWKEVISGCDDH